MSIADDRRILFALAALIAATLVGGELLQAWVTPSCVVRGTSPNNSEDLGMWCNIKDGTLYSGTCASIRGKWFGGSGDPIKKVQLWVNSICRYEAEWTSDYPDVWPAGEGCTSWLAVPFSTTQFGDGTTLSLKAKLWTKNGVYKYSTNTDHKAWNRAYVLQYPGFTYSETICNHVNSKCSSMKHTSPGPYASDDQEDIAGYQGHYGGRLKLFSVFYADTHGSCSNFADCYYPCDVGEDCLVTVYEAGAAVDAKEDANRPEYNFVFLDSCHSSDNADFYNAFETTSFLGWVGEPEDSARYANWTKALWDGLAMKKSVTQARAYADGQQEGITNDSGRGSGAYKVHLTYTSL